MPGWPLPALHWVRFGVVVQDDDDGPAYVFWSGAFGVHDLPDISSSFETEPDLKMPYPRVGVVTLRAGNTERRCGLAGDLHDAGRQEPLLGYRDGFRARALLAQIGVGGF